MNKTALIVEDDPLQQEMLAEMLEYKLSFSCVKASNGQEALELLVKENNHLDIQVIIMDIDMPIMNGIDALKIIHKKYPTIPVIMLTGKKNVDKAVECMKLGATDFLNKPYDITRMIVTIQNALKLKVLSKEVQRLKHGKQENIYFSDLVGGEEGLQDSIRLARKAVSSNIPVLIYGETGTGKEVFARAIHGESSPEGKPFIAVNCGAIPDQLVESTLFGHEKGAFTGATESVKGKFREADGGTIFLDEIGELPLEAQVKLLRVLQQKEVEPVGKGVSVPVNVRIISATNKNLEEAVKQGNFREDLFFRLSVFPMELPALRDRKQDIPLLANHFIHRFALQDQMGVKKLSSNACRYLMDQDWPGNVRQLENLLHRAMVISDSDMIDTNDLHSLGVEHAEQSSIELDVGQNENAHKFLNEEGHLKKCDDIEKELMIFALWRCENNITKAANDIGLAKSTFYKKMKLYGIARS